MKLSWALLNPLFIKVFGIKSWTIPQIPFGGISLAKTVEGLRCILNTETGEEESRRACRGAEQHRNDLWELQEGPALQELGHTYWQRRLVKYPRHQGGKAYTGLKGATSHSRKSDSSLSLQHTAFCVSSPSESVIAAWACLRWHRDLSLRGIFVLLQVDTQGDIYKSTLHR